MSRPSFVQGHYRFSISTLCATQDYASRPIPSMNIFQHLKISLIDPQLQRCIPMDWSNPVEPLWYKWKQRLVLSAGHNIILPTFQIVVIRDWYRQSSYYYHSCICKTSLQWYSKSFQWNWASPFTSPFLSPFRLLVMSHLNMHAPVYTTPTFETEVLHLVIYMRLL